MNSILTKDQSLCMYSVQCDWCTQIFNVEPEDEIEDYFPEEDQKTTLIVYVKCPCCGHDVEIQRY